MHYKKNLKFEDYKNCLEATQLENEINQLNLKKVIQNYSKYLKTRNSVLTEEFNKTALNASNS